MSFAPRPAEMEPFGSASNDQQWLGDSLPLDPFVAPFVRILRAGGVETFESCDGSEGHAFPEPTVRFHGNAGAGWHALSVAHDHALPVLALRREWPVIDGEPTGPWWSMTFRRRS